MQIPRDAMLLRIFIGESDRLEHQPLYEAIVMKARERHLAGATVLRGPMGFGAASRIHTAKILRLSMDLPIVIEIVDSEEKLNEFLPDLEHMIGGGLVTLEKIKVIITATTNRIESDGERRNHTLGIAGVPSVSISVLQFSQYLLLQMSARSLFNRTPLRCHLFLLRLAFSPCS